MKKPVYFISDVHLSPTAPERSERFVRFLEALPEGSEIYVLGDLVDAWIETPRWSMADLYPALGVLRRHRIGIIWGNRDFLAGRALEQVTGGRILGEFHDLEIGGKRIHLAHGDLFCTGDKSYQLFRTLVRSSLVRLLIRWAPSSFLKRMTDRLRRMSQREKNRKSLHQMELSNEALQRKFREGYDYIVCGHVHAARQGIFSVGGREAHLIVLSDWGSKEIKIGVWKEGTLLLKTIYSFL